ncbi:acid-sensing ion channel 4-A-like [Patella vulgata]|uniref:acid-sensing ion channel 4-A-like n=1 Tax=Patella vulgata TaxID=6465 RepID=UPI0024A82C83|nr:acid-sensing ion channel 4-A-like [Patella vulgata]
MTIVKAELNDELIFPAVTICNTNQYHRSRLPDDAPLQKLLYDLTHTLQEMFKFCWWGGRRIDCSEVFKREVTDVGVCYRFNGNTSDVLTTTTTGSRTGLRVILDIQQNFSFFSTTSKSGIKIDLRIFYDTLTVTKTEQIPELTVQGILADLGGHMGLFLGASILSVTELVEFVALFIMEWWKRRRQKKPKSSSPSQQQMTVMDNVAMS